MRDEREIDKYNKPFPTKLRILMGDKTTQKQLADAIGVSRQAISQYMNGETSPTIDKFELLIQYFGVSADYMLGLSEVSKNNLSVKEIHEQTGLSEKAIEVLSMEKNVYSKDNFLKTVNFLLEQMKGLQSFPHDEVFEYYKSNQDLLTLIDVYLNTEQLLDKEYFFVGEEGVSNDSFDTGRYCTRVDPEEVFKQVMINRISEELNYQRLRNLRNSGKYIRYDDYVKYIEGR